MYPPDWNEKVNQEANVEVTTIPVQVEVEKVDHPTVQVDEENGNTSFRFPPGEEENHKMMTKGVHRLRFA